MDGFLLFFVSLIACVYAAVGHGGATGYLALMSFYGIPSAVMATAALTLNVVTAGISFSAYAREGFFSFRLILPFLMVSIPFAYLGASLKLSESQFGWILGFVLLVSALRMWFYKSASAKEQADKFVKVPPFWITTPAGALLGFLSGAIGIGGGVFLSPLIILMGWADSKTTAGCSALFIILNSITGLTARHLGDSLDFQHILPLTVFALIGACLGSYWGAKGSTQTGLRRLIALVLSAAAFKLFL